MRKTPLIESQNMEVMGKHLCASKTKTDCIRRVIAAVTHWLIVPHPHQGTELFPEPLVSPVRKENLKETAFSSPQHCGSLWSNLHLDCTPQGLQRSLQGPATQNLWQSREEGLVCNKEHMGLGRLSSHQQCSRRNPNQHVCSSAQPSWACTWTTELGRWHIYLIWIPKWRILWL